MKKYYYALMTKLLEHRYRKTSNCIAVYMFHNITVTSTDTKNFNTNVIGFEVFLRQEMKCKKPIAIDDIGFEKIDNSFCITFDDAFSSVYHLAYPILKKYSIPFTVFLTIDYINRPNYLSMDEIKVLTKEPLCTIGAHTLTHPRLRTFKYAEKEITESKSKLEGIVGKAINHFAYPYGSIFGCSWMNIRQAKNAGYNLCFSTIKGYIHEGDVNNKYFLPRIAAEHIVKEIEKR